MKKVISMMLAAFMCCALAGCGSTQEPVRQTVLGALMQGLPDEIVVTADLTGGWSAQFAQGALYLDDSKGDFSAMLITQDQEAFDDYMKEALADPDHKEADGGVYYYTHGYNEDHGAFLRQIDDSIRIMISSEGEYKMNLHPHAVLSRILWRWYQSPFGL